MKQIKNVSIVDWQAGSRSYLKEPFNDLGYNCQLYDPTDPLPPEPDLFFSFGYIEDIFLFLHKLENVKVPQRPLFLHWNIEGVPDLRIPKWISKQASILRSYIGKAASQSNRTLLFQMINKKAHRFRYLGDYLYCFKHGLVQSLFDCSEIYVALEKSVGLPAHYVPWGTLRSDYSSLNLDRDIDVLWMGKPRNKRRNNLVKSIRKQLTKHGKNMVVIDGVEHPYVYGQERIKLFNRSKITLNLLPAWDAYNYIFKFHLAAGNRSLLISEPFLKHNPEYIDGCHYVSTNSESLVETLIYYSEHEQERSTIAENAYHLVTSSMTMTNSVKKIMSSIGV